MKRMLFPLPQSVLFWLRLVTVLEAALLVMAYACVLRKDRVYPAMRAYLLVNRHPQTSIRTVIGGSTRAPSSSAVPQIIDEEVTVGHDGAL